MRTDDYEGRDPAATLRELGVDPERGLGDAEVRERLARYGYNEIEEREEPLWHRIFRRFWGPIPWMIEVAAVLSAVVQKWEDFGVILVMLLVNGGLDFIQERRALTALAALKQRLARTSLALRDGSFRSVEARELVPGDIVRLRIGDIVPADVQLVGGDYLLIDHRPVGAHGRVAAGKQEAGGDRLREHGRLAGRDARRGREHRREHELLVSGRPSTFRTSLLEPLPAAGNDHSFWWRAGRYGFAPRSMMNDAPPSRHRGP